MAILANNSLDLHIAPGMFWKKSLAQFFRKDKNEFMDDHQFCQVLNRFGFSWSGYRKVRKGVKKRIKRHMDDLGCRSFSAYLMELDKSDEVGKKCELLLTVSISRFFRDRELWQSLEKKILPELIHKNSEKINVWSAGCACGDEVYSFKIVWDDLQNSVGHLPKLELIATDMNPENLDIARAGIYSSSSLKEVTKEFQTRYFKKKKGKKVFEINAWLKKDIVWKIHHLLYDPPGSKFDIIFLRNNVLTYYEDLLKKKAFRKILDSLAPFGFLIIGSHESLPFETRELTEIKPHPFVFRKIDVR
ncbi:MAG: CheR family methyltransferase [Desulfobacterales bacterium]